MPHRYKCSQCLALLFLGLFHHCCVLFECSNWQGTKESNLSPRELRGCFVENEKEGKSCCSSSREEEKDCSQSRRVHMKLRFHAPMRTKTLLIFLFILLFDVVVVLVASTNDTQVAIVDAEQNAGDVKRASEVVLSRRKRYLVFPTGSSISIAVCMTVGIYGNPQYSMIRWEIIESFNLKFADFSSSCSWGLNWGFGYNLPSNASYFKEKDNKEKRSVHETKPMMKRRYRLDLFNKLEIIMNQWVCLMFTWARLRNMLCVCFLFTIILVDVTLTRTSTCTDMWMNGLVEIKRIIWRLMKPSDVYEKISSQAFSSLVSLFWDLSLALILPHHDFILYLGWDMMDVNASSVPCASHQRFSANEESILSLSSLELFSPFPNPKCCHLNIPSWWFTIKLIVVANETQQNVTYFIRNVDFR